MGWGGRSAIALVLVAGCGRFGFDVAPGADGAVQDEDATASTPDARPGELDAALADAPPGDAGQGSTDSSGSFLLADPIGYSCAGGLVSVAVTTFFFNDDGTSLEVLSDDSGEPAQPCLMTGTSPESDAFDVTCTLPGTCDETYQLTGVFTDPDSISGTLSLEFQGACLDCTLQSFELTATRCQELSGCPASP